MEVGLADVDAHLRGVIYPTNRSDAVAAAQRNGAPEAFIRRLQELSEESFDSREAVVTAMRGA